MSSLMKKTNSNSQTMFQKTGASGRTFGKKNESHIFRKIANSINSFSEGANVSLGVASLLQPELAPVFGGLGLALKGSQLLANHAASGEKHANMVAKFDGGSNDKKKSPMLQR